MEELNNMNNMLEEEQVGINNEEIDTQETAEGGLDPAGVAIIGLAVVGGITIVKKTVQTVVKTAKKIKARKAEKAEGEEIDEKMKNHPGFLGKFKKDKKTVENDDK